MARGQRRVRKVLDRLRSITPRDLLGGPMARRLLVIGGLALAGWLLGHTGQAHAEAGHGLVAKAGGTAIGSPSHRGQSDGGRSDGGQRAGERLDGRLLAGGLTAGRLEAGRLTGGQVAAGRLGTGGLADGAVVALARHGAGHEAVAAVRPRVIVRGLVAAARRHDVLGRPIAIQPAVTGVLSPRGANAGTAAVPAHRAGASPRAAGARAAVRHGAGRHDGCRDGAASYGAAPFAGSAMEIGRWGRAHARTAPTDPAPLSGLSHQGAGETGALSSAGSAPTGGPAGHPARPEAAPRPSTALLSVLGAVPPAVHTATDEPAVSPD